MSASLARRAALATAAAITVGGVSVALVAGVLLDRFVADEDDERLGALAEAACDAEGEEEVEEEEDDARMLAGVQIAVYEQGRFVEGDRGLPRVAAGHCEERAGRRVCARAGRRLTAIAAASLASRDRLRAYFVLAAAIALLVTSLLGALASFRLARWSLAPLARLGDALRLAPSNAKATPDLGPREGVIEVDALRAALAGTFARLGVALRESERFAADAAHELRTPLTTILGELELLHEVVRAEPESSEVVARVRATAQRLATLVESLLAMARAASPIEVAESIDLAELVEDVVLELPRAEAARVQTELTADVRVRGDRALLSALLSNAIDNALKFSAGGPVRVRLAMDVAHVVVEVDDDGAGVPLEDRERVFEPFHRGVRGGTGDIPGHGIGLALVSRVALAHGGTARFVDRERGARLRVELQPTTSRVPPFTKP